MDNTFKLSKIYICKLQYDAEENKNINVIINFVKRVGIYYVKILDRHLRVHYVVQVDFI